MKKLLFVTLIMCLLNVGSITMLKGQTQIENVKHSENLFEGEIKYKFLMSNVEGKTNAEIEEEIKKSEKMMGRHATYFFKKGKMKSKIDGSFMKMTQYYEGGDSIVIVDDMSPKPTVMPLSSEWRFELDSMKIENNVTQINGIECNLIRFYSGKYEWKYYYNEEYKISGEDYQRYTSGFWNIAAKEVGALPLRFEGKIPGSYIFLEAEEILPKKLPDGLFTNRTLE